MKQLIIAQKETLAKSNPMPYLNDEIYCFYTCQLQNSHMYQTALEKYIHAYHRFERKVAINYCFSKSRV